MAQWGTRYIGVTYHVDKDEPLVAGKVYEEKFHTAIDVPDNLELPLIKEILKAKLPDGCEPTYVYVKRSSGIFQWYQRTASPVTAGAVFMILLACAIIVLAVGLTLVSLSRVEGLPATLALPTIGISAVLIIIVLVIIVLPALRRKP